MKQEYTGTLTSPSLEVLFNTYDVRTSQRIYHLINHREDAACVVVVACPGQGKLPTTLPDDRATRGGEGMTTLIAVYSSDGLVGRCDARCYLANQPDCDCICGGRNHGAGVQKAIDNTRELAQHWLCEYARKEGLTTFTTEIHQECAQATLWSEGRAR